MNKQCVRCSNVQPIDQFRTDKKSKDGHNSWCLTCHRDYDKTRVRDKADKQAYESSTYGRYLKLKRQAKSRGLEVTINFEQYEQIVALAICYWCGDSIVYRYGHSLDRLDNDKGYSFDNSVACCYTCNQMKRQFTQIMFIDKCRAISNKHSKT